MFFYLYFDGNLSNAGALILLHDIRPKEKNNQQSKNNSQFSKKFIFYHDLNRLNWTYTIWSLIVCHYDKQ